MNACPTTGWAFNLNQTKRNQNMKKLIAMAAVMLIAGAAVAGMVTMTYSPDTNGVVNVKAGGSWSPVEIYQEITGTTSNTATQAIVSGGVTYRLAPMAQVIGGAEAPVIMNAGDVEVAPIVLTKGDVWQITAVGVAYSNVSYRITFKTDN